MERENGQNASEITETKETKQVDSRVTDAVIELIEAGIIVGNPETGEEYPKEGHFKVADVLQQLEPSEDFQVIEIDNQGTLLLDAKGVNVRVKKDNVGGFTLEFSYKGEVSSEKA